MYVFNEILEFVIFTRLVVVVRAPLIAMHLVRLSLIICKKSTRLLSERASFLYFSLAFEFSLQCVSVSHFAVNPDFN
jgi:hypothetical protein